MRRISLIVALAVITSGCLTLTPVQRDAVVDVQRFADATTTAYKLPSIRLTIEPATNLGIGGRYRQGNFYLNETQLNSGSLTALVAHELAHYVLGHDAPLSGAASMAEVPASPGRCASWTPTPRRWKFSCASRGSASVKP